MLVILLSLLRTARYILVIRWMEMNILLVLRAGFATDWPGFVFARMGPVALLSVAFGALYAHNKEGARACTHPYLDVYGMESVKITSVNYCYMVLYDRIQSANDPAHFHGFYVAVYLFCFHNAIVGVILVELIMAFSGIPWIVFRGTSTLSSEAIAERLVKWVGWQYNGARKSPAKTGPPVSPDTHSVSATAKQPPASEPPIPSIAGAWIQPTGDRVCEVPLRIHNLSQLVPSPDQPMQLFGASLHDTVQSDQADGASLSPGVGHLGDVPGSQSAGDIALNQLSADCAQSSSFQCVDETQFGEAPVTVTSASCQPAAIPSAVSLSASDAGLVATPSSTSAPQVATSASAPVSRGWANHQSFWTANQHWRVVVCFMLARVCSVVIGPLVLVFADLFFFGDFVLLNSKQIFNDGDGICQYTFFEAGDTRFPVRLNLVCSLTANATYRWLMPVHYCLIIFLSTIMFCANLHWVIQFRRRRQFLYAAVISHLRTMLVAIDEDDVREFAAAVPAALWLCLKLLGSRKLSATEINELACLLYSENAVAETKFAAVPKIEVCRKHPRTRKEISEA